MYRYPSQSLYIYKVKGKESSLITTRRGEYNTSCTQSLLCKTHERLCREDQRAVNTATGGWE